MAKENSNYSIPDWITPPSGSGPVTMALVDFTNPVTGETFTARTGGYSLNMDVINASRNATGAEGGLNVGKYSPGEGEQFNEAIPPGLSRTNPNPRAIENTQSPGPGGTFAYNAQGQRYIVPENYDFENPNDGPKPGGSIGGPPLSFMPTGNESTAMATSNGQQLITGQPQSPNEVNVMDYQGVQAMDPRLQPQTQLGTQVVEQQVRPGEIQGVPTLGTAPTVGTVTAGPVAGVSAPEMPSTALADLNKATTVDRPDLTETSALESYEQISQAADAFQEAQLELSDVDPRATVQGQLALLQKQFEDGETPVWAQGAMKQATGLMAQRGLGSSTMAAEAITNALMQSTLPIAQQDASFYQNVTMTNLANSQAAEMTKFNARLTSIFNDQASENTARNINAASANELEQFYTDLSQNVVLTNTAATNAMEQFNATTRNQAEQFAAELGLTADQFSAEAINDRAEFDAELITTVAQFNANMKNGREQFNVQNQVAIDANNVQWRRDVNTANTATENAAIQFDIQNMLGLQQSALNNVWNHYDTILNMAYQSEESALDRAVQLALTTLQVDAERRIAEESSTSSLIGDIFEAGAIILGSDSGNSIVDKVAGWLP